MRRKEAGHDMTSMRNGWWRGRFTRLAALGLGTLPLLWAAITAHGRDSGAASFAIVVDKPYEEVVAVVGDVAHSSVIKGTFEYRDEEQLTKAEYAEKVGWFPPPSGAGKVFYKLRKKVLSPAHFVNSNDVGVVAVRYIVQANGANSTRLVIDAVFVESARHHWHASDGYVETCEFAEIGKRLEEYEQLRAQGTNSVVFSTSREGSLRQERPAAPSSPNTTGKLAEPDDTQRRDLERVIAEQTEQLKSEQAKLRQLEGEARQLRKAEYVRVSGERAELRVLPYAHARVVEALKKGQEVTILARSQYWYQVRSEDGQQGWVAQTLLEAHP